jgi:hypothetical protein
MSIKALAEKMVSFLYIDKKFDTISLYSNLVKNEDLASYIDNSSAIDLFRKAGLMNQVPKKKESLLRKNSPPPFFHCLHFH